MPRHGLRTHTLTPVDTRVLCAPLSLSSWMEYLDDLEEAARQERVAGAVVRRFLNRHVSMALNQWTGLWKERQRFKYLARRMGADGGVAKAWRQWMGVVEHETYMRSCLGRFAKQGLSKAYNRWLEALDERAAMRRFAQCASSLRSI